MLGLGQRARRESGGAPGWIGPREGGLPELATGGSAPPRVDSAAQDLDQRLRKLRSSDEPRAERRTSRPSKSLGAERVRSGSDLSESSRAEARRARPPDGAVRIPWWIGGVGVSLLFPVIGMIADKRRYGAIHPAWFVGVGSVIGLQIVADLIAYSAWGIEFTRWFLEGTPGLA